MYISERHGGLRTEPAAALPDRDTTEQSLWELWHTELQPLANGCVGNCCRNKGVWAASSAPSPLSTPARQQSHPKNQGSLSSASPSSKETFQAQGTARKCLGSGRKQKSIEGSWSPRCLLVLIHECVGRALGQVESQHRGPANPSRACCVHTRRNGEPRRGRWQHLTSRPARIPRPFLHCKGIPAIRDGKITFLTTRVVQHRNRGWRGGGISSRCSKLAGRHAA